MVSGIGNLVDADVAKGKRDPAGPADQAAAQCQALSIANGSSSILLSLFR